jgi:hypothetical protein
LESEDDAAAGFDSEDDEVDEEDDESADAAAGVEDLVEERESVR